MNVNIKVSNLNNIPIKFFHFIKNEKIQKNKTIFKKITVLI